MTIQSSLAGVAAEPLGDVFRDGAFRPDSWRRLPDDAPLPPDGGALLGLARFLAEEAAGTLGNGPVGVVVEPADRVAALIPHLGRIDVIAVNFPKFSDGRGFSHAARIVRSGFAGELRAVGDVLIDQIDFMRRQGFTSFAVAHGVTRAYLSEGRNPSPRHYYQPAMIDEPPAGTRPWLRRAEDR